MPYPAAREHPETTPCVKTFRGKSDGVREAAKNNAPRRRPPVDTPARNPVPPATTACTIMPASRQTTCATAASHARRDTLPLFVTGSNDDVFAPADQTIPTAEQKMFF